MNMIRHWSTTGHSTDWPRFKVSFWHGDEWMKASVHLDWRWRGIAHWHVWFLPDWVPLPSRLRSGKRFRGQTRRKGSRRRLEG